MHQIKEMILILGKNMLTLTDVLVLHNFVIKCVSNKKLSAGKKCNISIIERPITVTQPIVRGPIVCEFIVPAPC